MPWNLDSDRPIFIQIIDRIQADIIAGCYQPGDKLPSVRELAQDASVNPNTMQKALSELERTGLVYSQRTSGRFITEDREMIRALREQQGQQIALHFLENMKKLGYGKDEILALLTQLLETALHNQPHSTETHGHSAETHTQRRDSCIQCRDSYTQRRNSCIQRRDSWPQHSPTCTAIQRSCACTARAKTAA